LMYHFNEHAIGFFKPMHYINQNQKHLWLGSVLQIVFNQLTPLQDLIFRGVTCVSVAWSID
jgi:hypothetical protein